MSPRRPDVLACWVVPCALAALFVVRADASPRVVAFSERPQVGQSGLFELYSEVFINMHHALYRWGVAGPGADLSRVPSEVRVQAEDMAFYESRSGGEKRRWDPPVAFYRLLMINRDLVFDDDMRRLRDCLVERSGVCGQLAAEDFDTLQLLITYMGTYRSWFWTRHDAVNRAWIAAQLPLLERFEDQMSRRVALAYGGFWPPARSRVDVSFYANEVGGYTTGDGHIVVSSNEIGNQGTMGLELLFHEASHGATMELPLRAMVERSFAAVEAEAPVDLWHLVIFYTTGHLTRQVLGEADVEYPQTFAELSGMWERGDDNRRAKAVLDADWKAALDAREGFEEAMVGVATAWVAATGPGTR